MATEGAPSIRIEDDHVHLSGLDIIDSSVVTYLKQFTDEERADALLRALRIGVTALDLAETSRQEEYVERKFDDMRREPHGDIERLEAEVDAKFGTDGDVSTTLDTHLGPDGHLKQHIDDAFGEDGLFSRRLDEELGEDGERIQQALDPDTEGTPTYRLKQTFREEVRSLRDKVEEQAAAAETEEELRRKTPLKGDDFEETVDTILSGLVYDTNDELEYTGDTNGEISGQTVGDFVVTLNETG